MDSHECCSQLHVAPTLTKAKFWQFYIGSVWKWWLSPAWPFQHHGRNLTRIFSSLSLLPSPCLQALQMCPPRPQAGCGLPYRSPSWTCLSLSPHHFFPDSCSCMHIWRTLRVTAWGRLCLAFCPTDPCECV
jgi:hypothetical protein